MHGRTGKALRMICCFPFSCCSDQILWAPDAAYLMNRSHSSCFVRLMPVRLLTFGEHFAGAGSKCSRRRGASGCPGYQTAAGETQNTGKAGANAAGEGTGARAAVGPQTVQGPQHQPHLPAQQRLGL